MGTKMQDYQEIEDMGREIAYTIYEQLQKKLSEAIEHMELASSSYNELSSSIFNAQTAAGRGEVYAHNCRYQNSDSSEMSVCVEYFEDSSDKLTETYEMFDKFLTNLDEASSIIKKCLLDNGELISLSKDALDKSKQALNTYGNE